jgi:hypothetical protein
VQSKTPELAKARPNVAAKATRLLVDGRVSVYVGDDRRLHAIVAGDHGRYVVSITRSGDAICSCASRLKCSHAIAVERVTRKLEAS